MSKFTYKVESAKFIKKHSRYSRWDGKIRLYTKSRQFPAGLAPVVEAVAKAMSVPCVNLVNQPDDGCGFTVPENSMRLKPRPYQLAAAEWAIEQKRCIILSSTSSGKTLVAWMLADHYVREGLNVLMIVPSRHLLNQAIKDFGSYPKYDWLSSFASQFHIYTWQKLQHEPDEYFEQFDAVIVDEVHLAKAKELKRIMMACVNAYHRVGMTGTMDGSESNMLLYGLFGKTKRFSSNIRLMEEGHITRSHTRFVYLNHGSRKWPRKYQDEIAFISADEARNAVVVDEIAKAVDAGENSFVMVKRVEHAELLKSLLLQRHGIKAVVMTMKTKPRDRTAIFNEFERNNGMVLIGTYNLISTGISVNNLHNLYLAAPVKSVITYMQSIGRVFRLHDDKDVAKIHDFIDVHGGITTYSSRHGASRVMITLDEGLDFSEERINVDHDEDIVSE